MWQGRAINCFYSSLAHFKHHLRESIPMLVKATHLCRQRGDHQFFGYASYFVFEHLFHSGHPLEVVLAKLQALLEQVEAQRVPLIVCYLSLARHLVLQLASEEDASIVAPTPNLGRESTGR